MLGLLGKRRRSDDERRLDGGTRAPLSHHPLFSTAIDSLGSPRWAVACNAEFRTDGGDAGLRGLLHHDGAILRFTTWGGIDRFAAAPMEFEWEQVAPGSFDIAGPAGPARFTRLAPLSSFVASPPPFAAAEDEDLAGTLSAWMRSWATADPAPLASPG